MWLLLWLPATGPFKDRVHSERRLSDNNLLADLGCESLQELLLQDDWRAPVDVLVYEVFQLRLLGAAPLCSVFCEGLRLNVPGRNTKIVRDLREQLRRLLRGYALEDIDSCSSRLCCFVLEEPSLWNWV